MTVFFGAAATAAVGTAERTAVGTAAVGTAAASACNAR